MQYDPNANINRPMRHNSTPRSSRPPRRRRVTVENYCFTKEDLLSLLDTINKVLTQDLSKALKEMAKEVKGKEILTKSLLTKAIRDRSHNIKDDSDIVEIIEKALDKYKKIIPDLRDKIEDYVEDSICSNTSNLNYKLILAIISEGSFIAENGHLIISYIINKYYVKGEFDTTVEGLDAIPNRAILFMQLIAELYKADLEKVVDTIGNIPSVRTLRFEETSEIPTGFIVTDFFSKKFGIKDFVTKVWVSKLLNYFTGRDARKIAREHPEVVSTFIGNPIYHLRLLLVDLEMLRLEALKERRRLLELKLLELKQKEATGQVDPKLEKQIKYYEEKLNKVNMKIEKIMDVRVN